ncbi:restriction endonuclease subunit S, partial [Flavobacteriaceae bacterium]|nr:restriction endonuclease subunit S [Flavobacteriaceae bacterium]
PHIYFKDYRSEPFPVIPLPEQKQITEVLEQTLELIDKAKSNVEKNIENAKELFQSKLNQIFSQTGEDWEINAIKDVGETQTGSTPPTKDKSNYGNFIPFAKPPHFNKNGTLNTGDSMLSELGLKKSRLIKANSVLMVCIGATIGKTAFTKEDICSNQQINALTPKENYAPKLLYYAMISTTFQNKVKSEGKSAQATLPIINKSKWSNLKINLPQNIIKQKEIVESLDIMDNHVQSLLMSYKEELKNLEELKKSILQKAFAGELTNKKDAS